MSALRNLVDVTTMRSRSEVSAVDAGAIDVQNLNGQLVQIDEHGNVTSLGGSSGGGSASSMIGNSQVDVDTDAAVVALIQIDFANVFTLRLVARAMVTGGSGTMSIRVGGTDDSVSDGTLVTSLVIDGTTFDGYDSGAVAVSFSGIAIVKLVMDPSGVTSPDPDITPTLSANYADVQVQ